MNQIKKRKHAAAESGMELYWSPEWRSWGLVDPEGRVEGEWFSSSDFHELTDFQWNISICAMLEKRHPTAAGDFPL